MYFKKLGLRLGHWLVKKCGGHVPVGRDTSIMFEGAYFKVSSFRWERNLEGEEINLTLIPPYAYLQKFRRGVL